MAIKEVNIEIPKMDYQIISISIKDGETLSQLGENDLMFFTVKESVYSEDNIFQKSLDDGIVYNSTTQKYEVTINSEDTKDMDMGKEYGYDITIYFDGNKPKQKVVGTFTLSKKYTLNEVS